jgi:chorismate mutase
LPNPVIPELNFPAYLKNNDINLNPKLYKIYVEKIVPAITKPGDDQNYGTSATRDVEVLQALSRRVHYGI